jgi:lipopolysaccharide/colanic/teichoic acid biosynthesis glycosyltransferase
MLNSGNSRPPRSMWLRELLEQLTASILLLLVTPVLATAALCIALESGTPILFRQLRIGKHGKQFFIVKLRSMYTGSRGGLITVGRDPRVTRIGAFLRKYKLDELPQLWNIVKGEMQFIGPRPEVPPYVDRQNPLWDAVLAVKPGLSDLATLVYRDEQIVLARSGDPEYFYREKLLPAKLALSAQYQQRRTLLSDLRVIALTITASLRLETFTSVQINTLLRDHE